MGSVDYTDAVNGALDRLLAPPATTSASSSPITGRWLRRRWPNSGVIATRSTAGLRPTCVTVTTARCRIRRSPSSIGRPLSEIAAAAVTGLICSAVDWPTNRGGKCCGPGGRGYCRAVPGRSPMV